MKVDIGGLKRFERRVRLVRSWRGLAIGLTAGAAISAAWAILDWMKISYTEWSWMGTVVGVSGAIGMLVGYFMRVPLRNLSDSIDRRGGLENRLTTSMEVSDETEFGDALQHDATDRLGKVQPNQLYPMRVGRWQATAVLVSVLASTIFLLGNSPILLNAEARKDREELKKLGTTVERIIKPVTETGEQQELTPQEKRLIDEVRKLQRDMERAKINKEEAMQKTNDLAKKAQEMMQERAKMTEENLAKAESAMEKLEKAELEKDGQKLDSEDLKKLSEMNKSGMKTDQQKAEQQKEKSELQQKAQQMQQQKSELQKKIDELSKKLQDPKLSAEQRKAMEEMQKKLQEMMKGLEKELAEIQKRIAEIMKDQEIQEMLKKIMEHPAMKELQEMAQKLAEEAQKQQNSDPQNPEMQKLTKEQLEQMKQQLEEAAKQLKELAKQLKDPKALEEFMEQLKEALKNMKAGGQCNKMGFGLMGLFGLPGMSGMQMPGANGMQGMPGPGGEEDTMSVDTGKVNHNPNGKEGGGQTTITQIKGDRQKNGEESYIEIKGPTSVGTRSSVKYTKVLPSYKKKAEEAIGKKSIPKQHEKRVKEYFDSLSGGK